MHIFIERTWPKLTQTVFKSAQISPSQTISKMFMIANYQFMTSNRRNRTHFIRYPSCADTEWRGWNELDLALTPSALGFSEVFFFFLPRVAHLHLAQLLACEWRIFKLPQLGVHELMLHTVFTPSRQTDLKTKLKTVEILLFWSGYQAFFCSTDLQQRRDYSQTLTSSNLPHKPAVFHFSRCGETIICHPALKSSHPRR